MPLMMGLSLTHRVTMLEANEPEAIGAKGTDNASSSRYDSPLLSSIKRRRASNAGTPSKREK